MGLPELEPVARVALGVMARAPVPGRCKTRLARRMGGDLAAALYDAMLRDTLDVCARIPFGRHVVLAAPEDDGVASLRRIAPASWDVIAQSGDDLGGRLVHAAATLARDGHAIVIVGSDAPSAPFHAIAGASAHLAVSGRALLGPSHDGGYWLIGLQAADPRAFDGIAWSTSDVLAQTRARCDALALDVRELPCAYDVDEPEDVTRLATDLRHDPALAPHTARFLHRHAL